MMKQSRVRFAKLSTPLSVPPATPSKSLTDNELAELELTLNTIPDPDAPAPKAPFVTVFATVVALNNRLPTTTLPATAAAAVAAPSAHDGGQCLSCTCC
jgi:hypothetical protein